MEPPPDSKPRLNHEPVLAVLGMMMNLVTRTRRPAHLVTRTMLSGTLKLVATIAILIP